MNNPSISKSKFLSGFQCPKLLWFYYHAKDKFPSVDEQTEAKFNQGKQVGLLAQSLFPGGITIDHNPVLQKTFKISRNLLPQRKPLFEAGFNHGRAFAIADILNPVRSNKWDIIEVKMGTRSKPENLQDIAFQRYCYEGAGIPIGRCYLMHINPKYKRHGAIDPKHLFVSEDVTDSLKELLKDMKDRIKKMLDIIDSKKCPEIDIGLHCDAPYERALNSICWKKVYKHENNVFTLREPRKRDWKLYKTGVLTNDDIPADLSLTTKQKIQLAAEKSGRLQVDKRAVKKFLKKLRYPLYYMDFETFGLNVPIPLIDKTRPYQHVPFQYSVHYQRSAGGTLDHHSWIWDGKGDPRKELLARLQRLLGKRGSIVAYNAAYEIRMLNESAAEYPKYAKWVKDISARTIDLLEPFRNFTVYHADQHGSASLKAVLPALTGAGYDNMAISDGGQASQEFVDIMFGNSTAEQRQTLIKNLEQYCSQDTLGMVDIMSRLTELNE